MADLQKKRFRLNYNMVLILICLVLFLGFGLVRSSFFSGKYIVDVLKMAVEIGIIVLPTTLLVIMGCIDFSMCAVLSLAAVISGIVTTQTNGFVGLLACLLVGVLCGSFNGLLVAVLRLPPMVTTLATMYLFKGIAEGITLGTSIGTNVAGTPLAIDDLGSSPRVWGRWYCGCGKYCKTRFIPTRVGQMGRSHSCSLMSTGSSPRVWGR